MSALRKPVLILMIALLIGSGLLLLAAALQPDEKPGSLRIAVSSTPLSAPFYVAEKLGYFDEQAVQVELLDVAGGANCFDLLLQGKADLATSSDSVVMFNGFYYDHFAVIASFVESDNDIKLISREPLQLEASRDLSRLRIGVVENSASEYFLHNWLKHKGLDPLQPVYVPLDITEMHNALASGQVDLLSVWEPYAYKIYLQGADQINIVDTKGLFNLRFNLLELTDQPELQEQKQQVLLALQKAVHYIRNNPEAAQLILRHRLKLTQEFIDWSWKDYHFHLGLDNEQLSSLQHQAQWALSHGLVENHALPDYARLMDLNPISGAGIYNGKNPQTD
ncbi:ABC transporter substrate-binding protein [Neptuniibacter halophilus]|uniref:ABC transporter substrate-binding protein n=1 Tax=Neptuniibacter halophilus TaxID=651666 RepID=UPI0025744A34|nr:ABC transporter substrate-binding protein [Neptuniibacter halophilus]